MNRISIKLELHVVLSFANYRIYDIGFVNEIVREYFFQHMNVVSRLPDRAYEEQGVSL